MDAVLALLTTSAYQSGIMQQMEGNGQSDMDAGAGEESVIEHNGKKYSRI